MTPREVFLSRRHRVGLIVGVAVAMACAGVTIGMTLAGVFRRPDGRIEWVIIGSNGVLFAYCLFVLIKRVQWLDSAVPEPVPPGAGHVAHASRPAA